MMRALVCMIAILLAAPASAHESRPLTVTIEPAAAGFYQLNWRAPASIDAAAAPEVRLGAPCTLAQPAGRPDARTGAALYECDLEASGASLIIDYPVFNPSVSTLVRMRRPAGDVVTQTLSPDVREWRIPPADTFSGVARSYLELGVKHILVGIDHVLFILGLMILARTPRRVLITATGFTVAHSITLAAVALGYLRTPVSAVEAIIALSIVFVAAEIARGDRSTLAWRRPIIVASAFGLLHGAGFASVLTEIGLPQSEKTGALLFFNIGVEIGQVVIIVAGFAAYHLVLAARRLAHDGVRTPLPHPARSLAGYGLGVLSAWWFVERTALMIGFTGPA